MAPDFELDPERSLWKPNRRFFLFSAAAAMAGTVLPQGPHVSALEFLAQTPTRTQIQAAVIPTEIVSYFSIAELLCFDRPDELALVRKLGRRDACQASLLC